MFPTTRIIVLLLVLQIATTVFLWALDALNQISEEIFALFLAVDLISFAMISYVYLSEKWGEFPNRGWIVAGCAMVLVLLFSSFFLK